MSEYVTYQGLHGETIPVRKDTLAAPGPIHRLGRFPYASLAQRTGRKRDEFATISRQLTWIDRALKSRAVRDLLEA